MRRKNSLESSKEEQYFRPAANVRKNYSIDASNEQMDARPVRNLRRNNSIDSSKEEMYVVRAGAWTGRMKQARERREHRASLSGQSGASPSAQSGMRRSTSLENLTACAPSSSSSLNSSLSQEILSGGNKLRQSSSDPNLASLAEMVAFASTHSPLVRKFAGDVPSAKASKGEDKQSLCKPSYERPKGIFDFNYKRMDSFEQVVLIILLVGMLSTCVTILLNPTSHRQFSR